MTQPARATTGIAPELARVLVAAIGIALPFAIGVAVGDRAPDVPLEPRYASVIGGACLASLAVLAESATARGRRVCLALVLAPLAHVIGSGSPTLAGLDVITLLGSAATIGVRAGLRIRRLPLARAPRIAAVAVLVLSVPGPLGTLGWGLVATVLAPALTRVFHASPEIGPGERAVSFASRDGTVLRATYAPGRAGAPGLVLVHGMGDSRRRLVPWARELASHGAHVLRIDLRANGTSDGVAITFADREPDDVAAALRFLASQPDVGPLHVLGVSMGGGASLTAVSRGDIHVVSTVALAPASDYRLLVDGRLPHFEPIHSLARGIIRGVTHGLGNRSPLELAPADDVVRAGPAPILIVHSRSDTTVPASVTEALARRAPWVEVIWIDDVSHVATPEHTLTTPALRDRIAAFLGVTGS